MKISDVAERYLGMKPATADKKAGAGDLPIPTFRIGDSQKAPRQIHVQDLADFIDKRRQEAQDELERLKYKRREAAKVELARAR
ncbi:pyocin activator PrtN family protein [Sodalis sp. dw_96]|uniref:pyocin activator PrtN family protein n=1 Tax=Sodalis sp. dw_96 TaxID=2719794 RepID=UPI0021047FE7|nr:pyocin activator PrtN family protein [Sodalis sp. dw_96]